jgi:hypothetical protein
MTVLVRREPVLFYNIQSKQITFYSMSVMLTTTCSVKALCTPAGLNVLKLFTAVSFKFSFSS